MWYPHIFILSFLHVIFGHWGIQESGGGWHVTAVVVKSPVLCRLVRWTERVRREVSLCWPLRLSLLPHYFAYWDFIQHWILMLRKALGDISLFVLTLCIWQTRWSEDLLMGWRVWRINFPLLSLWASLTLSIFFINFVWVLYFGGNLGVECRSLWKSYFSSSDGWILETNYLIQSDSYLKVK